MVTSIASLFQVSTTSNPHLLFPVPNALFLSLDEGDIWTWGHGGNGRLGHGGTEDVKRPKLVELPDVDIKVRNIF